MTTYCSTVSNCDEIGSTRPTRSGSTKSTRSPPWLTMYTIWSAKSRMLIVWQIRPVLAVLQ